MIRSLPELFDREAMEVIRSYFDNSLHTSLVTLQNSNVEVEVEVKSYLYFYFIYKRFLEVL